jgi:hypothetical protein
MHQLRLAVSTSPRRLHATPTSVAVLLHRHVLALALLVVVHLGVGSALLLLLAALLALLALLVVLAVALPDHERRAAMVGTTSRAAMMDTGKRERERERERAGMVRSKSDTRELTAQVKSSQVTVKSSQLASAQVKARRGRAHLLLQVEQHHPPPLGKHRRHPARMAQRELRAFDPSKRSAALGDRAGLARSERLQTDGAALEHVQQPRAGATREERERERERESKRRAPRW